jgi:hypothetical protein
MRLGSLIAVALLGTALSGCASIIKGSSEDIAVSTPPAPGAACTLSSPRGTWNVTTPAKVHVMRSMKDMNIVCNKDGYQSASTMIPSGVEPWTFGNLLIGGLLGVGIDAYSGAMGKYPDKVEVQMKPSATGEAEPAQGPAAAPAKASSAPTS